MPSVTTDARLAPPSPAFRMGVVGAGAGGSIMLWELARNAEAYRGGEIVLFDKHTESWGGTAHSARTSTLFVNMRPELHDLDGMMSFRAFCAAMGWRSRKLPVRWLLASYLKFTAECGRTRLELAGVTVTTVQEEVIRLRKKSARIVLTTHAHRSISCDFVVLSTGNQAPSIPASLFAKELEVRRADVA